MNNNFAELENVMRSWATDPRKLIVDSKPLEANNIAFHCGNTEMLKVSENGFWVRGVKIEQDEREAETVYIAFKQFLVWAEMNRQ